MNEIPEGVIERLSTYLNCLIKFQQSGIETVSSERLGTSSGVNPAEVRRDFTYFGNFGKKGVGYEVELLIRNIQRILGSDEPHKIALVGAGNLGSAIASYEGLLQHGFHIAAIFDSDPNKVGNAIRHLEVFDIKDLPAITKNANIEIGIVAVPSVAAQAAADLLVKGGVSVILNYTPALINVPAGVQLHNSDPVQQLLHTLYYLSANDRKLARKKRLGPKGPGRSKAKF
ncbi:MAG: redox-sensing transcriptional repressor Rex [Rubrobacteridae bacterium]|nr:redox-sensing transcriptional repressor Rex [Rubrobacteridae bacterium]